jgi:hypothetical protein
MRSVYFVLFLVTILRVVLGDCPKTVLNVTYVKNVFCVIQAKIGPVCGNDRNSFRTFFLP